MQRKNGLFKKAYELGVLCSVDVAVIIFGAWTAGRALSRADGSTEDRPGHQAKLYQYASSDVDAIVQRQISVRIPSVRPTSHLTTRSA